MYRLWRVWTVLPAPVNLMRSLLWRHERECS